MASLPEFEQRVMNQLWEHHELTARELTDMMYPNATHASYTTVKKLLERLESKGFVKRSADKRSHRFMATVEREELVANELEDVVDRLCSGSISPLVNALINGVSLTKQQRAELNQLIVDFQRDAEKTSRRRKKQ